MKQKPIYVEIFIKCNFDDLWKYTQEPKFHQRWDLRFTEIKDLPRENEDSPQEFLYTTKIGFGLKISGKGESKGVNNKANGESSSALKFWSDQWISLIKVGSGYWKYVPEEKGIKFFTWYDYKTRFGLLGSILDKLVFRPLIGWATAWSFDVLRLWLEKSIQPEISISKAISHYVSRLSISLIWLYQGLVPKLIFKDSGELAILKGSGLLNGCEENILTIIGIAEIIFGLIIIFKGNNKNIHYLNIFALLFLLTGAIISQPQILVAPFNPITLTIAMISLSIICINNLIDLPTAKNCLRSVKK